MEQVLSDTLNDIDSKIDFWADFDRPSPVKAMAFGVLFSIIAVIHTIQLLRFRTWFFLPLWLGNVALGAGYIFRFLSIRSPTDERLWVTQFITILVAPAFVSATIYMLISRLMALRPSRPRLTVLRGGWMTFIFVLADILSFALQFGGGLIAYRAKEKGDKLSEEKYEKEIHHAIIVIMVGIIFQAAALIFFLINTAIFHVREKKHYASASGRLFPQGFLRFLLRTGRGADWHVLLGVMYIATVLVLTRQVFRAVEFSPRGAGFVHDERFFYGLEAAPILLTTFILAQVYPGAILKDAERIAEKEDY